jgi:hypothetical protein
MTAFYIPKSSYVSVIKEPPKLAAPVMLCMPIEFSTYRSFD